MPKESDIMSDDSLQVFTAKPGSVDPDRNIVATYYIEGKGITIQQAAVKIAAEESIGTWTEVTTATSWLVRNLPAKAFEFKTEDGTTGFTKVAYPVDLFDYETGGVPNILSIIAGNLFGSGSLNNIRLIDVAFPRSVVSTLRGPKFGIEGVRKLIGTDKDRRPHLGTIIKPKVGLIPKETANAAFEAAVSGVDFIKDDETLTDRKFCPLLDRVSAGLEVLDKAKSETGRTTLYAPDVTAETYMIGELADKVIAHGAPFLMVDVVPCGYSAVRMLAEDPSIKVPIRVHRAGHGAFTRNPKHGISMKVLAEFTRLAGGDQLHTGTATGKMDRKIPEILETNNFLRGQFFDLKTTMPVASGGVHPMRVPANIETLGNDLVIQAGGEIQGHPGGTRAGAKAMRQAIDACMKGLPLQEYAKTHRELDLALKHWGKTFLI